MKLPKATMDTSMSKDRGKINPGEPDTSSTFFYTLWAIRGIQAGKPYFVVMCPLKLVPRLFLYDEEELPPSMRAQRTLNRTRIPEIARYITENRNDYVFSSIAASIDSEVSFRPLKEGNAPASVGELIIPMTARFVVNDGQHRRAGIEEALKLSSDFEDETISVVLFLDPGLKQSQQMFADLNKHAVRPTKSLGILYDHRDAFSMLACRLAESVLAFRGLTEMEKTTISNRSVKLFTLSGIYEGTKALLNDVTSSNLTPEDETLAATFWGEVAKCIPDWERVRTKKSSSAEMRQEYIHSHSLTLHVLGIVGASLIKAHPKDWQSRMSALSTVDWSRANYAVWEGRATVGGRLSKASSSILLTVTALKKVLCLQLTAEEAKAEQTYQLSRGPQ
jgi:DNA sulfur modification protein DndB